MTNLRTHVSILIVVVILGVFRLCLREIPLDRVGVKSNRIGKGVVEKDYAPGFCFVIPGIQRLYLMDPTVQDYTMAPEVAITTERFFRGPEVTFVRGEPIQLRAQDQFTLDVDITVLYRIRPGMAHNVLVKLGPEYGFHAILEQQARKVIWDVLAQLNTPDFYNAELRTTQAEMAREEINRALEPYFLEVVVVLVRNITYQQEYEQELLDRQLIDLRKLIAEDQLKLEQAQEKTQLVEMATSASVMAIRANLDADRKRLVAETDAEVARIKADADLEAQKMLAEAESYKRQQIAQGELATTSATAVGDNAITEAYEGIGGELYLAKQILENIEIGDIELNTNQTNPFDVEKMLELIGLDLDALKQEPAGAAPKR